MTGAKAFSFERTPIHCPPSSVYQINFMFVPLVRMQGVSVLGSQSKNDSGTMMGVYQGDSHIVTFKEETESWLRAQTWLSTVPSFSSGHPQPLPTTSLQGVLWRFCWGWGLDAFADGDRSETVGSPELTLQDTSCLYGLSGSCHSGVPRLSMLWERGLNTYYVTHTVGQSCRHLYFCYITLQKGRHRSVRKPNRGLLCY